jgi:hypothetical protein
MLPKLEKGTFSIDLTSVGDLRPNILMYKDSTWNSDRSDAQEERFKEFMHRVKSSGEKCVIIELGMN